MSERKIVEKRTDAMSYKTDFDKLLKELDAVKPNPDELVSKNSDKNTRELFSYLKSVYGKKALAGQQYLQKEEYEDIVYYRETGRLPAVRGYDFMDIDKGEKSDNQVSRAIEWAKNSGCIITMCWHWYAPDDMNDMENCTWAFYDKETSYDWKTSFSLLNAVEEGTAEYEFVVSRIDMIAGELRKFEKEGIPVLWRPLHEAYGNWFWWGRKDSSPQASVEAYKKLWYMIFDRLENYHKLTNLIWVWNGQNKIMEVNPNTYDFCGEDIYPQTEDHSSQKAKYDELTSYTFGKMTALTECGYIPKPENLIEDGVRWLWWLPWWGSFVYEMKKPQRENNTDDIVINSDKMSTELLKGIFDHDYCVTLDKLPWFSEKNNEYVEKRMSKTKGETLS